jgi:hypothetical protein
VKDQNREQRLVRRTNKPRFRQIAGYVTVSEQAAALVYANGLGLGLSSLLNLLVRRELKIRQIGALIQAFPDRPLHRDCVKAIAHLDDSSLNNAFVEHAEEHGLSVALAAGLLLRAELEERWLERSLLQSWSADWRSPSP